MRKAWPFWAVCLGLCVSLLKAQTPATDQEWETVRRAAYTQHEAVSKALRENDFPRVASQMRAFYALKFPADYEWLLSQEIDIVADSLMHSKQYSVAHQVLDDGLRALKVSKNRVALLRKKAYIFRQQGLEQEALRFFEESVSLERSEPR